MKASIHFTLLLVLLSVRTIASDEKNTVKANLATVTIYRTGAEMNHTAKANLSKGDNELVIEGISSFVELNSIQVNCPAAVTILGIEFSNNYLVPEFITPGLRKIR